VSDIKQGFHTVAKHYYFPGWHQPSSVGEFLVNLKKWQELPEGHGVKVHYWSDAILAKMRSAWEEVIAEE